MSDTSHATAHDEAHTGPIKTPGNYLLAAPTTFVIPIFVIIGLVYYVTSDSKPAAGLVNAEKALAERIQRWAWSRSAMRNRRNENWPSRCSPPSTPPATPLAWPSSPWLATLVPGAPVSRLVLMLC